METKSDFYGSLTPLYATSPSEQAAVIRPRKDRVPVEDRRGIIYIHGHGADARTWVPGYYVADHAQVMADAGYWCMSADCGGPATWNNAIAMASITAQYNWLVAQGMQKTKIALVAWSMGGGNALQWIKENPTKVSGALLFAPVTNLDVFCAPGGIPTAEANAAYSGNYIANSPGRKISDELPTWRNKCPIKIVHGDADPTAPYSYSQTFVAGVGQTQVTLTTISGGNHTDILSSFTPQMTKAFMDTLTF